MQYPLLKIDEDEDGWSDVVENSTDFQALQKNSTVLNVRNLTTIQDGIDWLHLKKSFLEFDPFKRTQLHRDWISDYQKAILSSYLKYQPFWLATDFESTERYAYLKLVEDYCSDWEFAKPAKMVTDYFKMREKLQLKGPGHKTPDLKTMLEVYFTNEAFMLTKKEFSFRNKKEVGSKKTIERFLDAKGIGKSSLDKHRKNAREYVEKCGSNLSVTDLIAFKVNLPKLKAYFEENSPPVYTDL